jgi:DNA-binding response OmpR family regulator
MSDAVTRVLVVDDDPQIVRTYDEILRTEKFGVLTAGSCRAAMAQLDTVKGDVQVLVVDIGLPDGDGSDFVRDAAKKYGDRPTLYVTGWSDEFWQLSDVPGRWLVMRKPVPIRRLLAGVRWLAQGGPKPAELDQPRE